KALFPYCTVDDESDGEGSMLFVSAADRGRCGTVESLLRENTGARLTTRTYEMALACAIVGRESFAYRTDEARRYRQIVKMLENKIGAPSRIAISNVIDDID
ncbi:MAG: hypothetical protein OXF02_03530, partial [Simkaniaceae bacterium]|nr:hypothetical protein [Simkaniaceae bacterium]